MTVAIGGFGAGVVPSGTGRDVRAAPPARKPDAVILRNNLLPGHLTRHTVSRTVRRTMKKADHEEVLLWDQRGRLVQCNMEPSDGGMLVYQMFSDQAARVKEALRGGKVVAPTPPAARFNLPLGSTRLRSATATARDAPAYAPLADPVQKVLLHLILDHAHWPAKRIEAGYKWKTAVRVEGFEGTQTMQFVDLVKIKGDVSARLTMFVEGAFTDDLARDYEFDKIQAIVHWSRPDSALARLDAQAFYHRRREPTPDAFELKVRARLTDRRILNEDEQHLVKEQLTLFAEALDDFSAGRMADVLRKCGTLRETWPDSIWRPAFAELARQASPDEKAGGRTTGEVMEALAQAVIAWEAARESDEPDVAEKARRVLQELVDKERDRIVRLTREKDARVRSIAIFALAMSPRSDDADMVELALRDKATNVRSMALAGLVAARRPDHVAPKTLLRLLEDKSGAVRRRACQAVGACVPRESPSIVEVVEKISHVMIHDESDRVRREAVHALAAVGAPADVPRLEKALRHEMNQENRRAIEKAIETLRDRE